MKTRKESVDALNRVMARFPLILEILEKLGRAEVPFPGDADIRHGCERALTAMLLELARISPAPAGRHSKSEETVLNWLNAEQATRLVDADHLQRLQQFIERILGDGRQHH